MLGVEQARREGFELLSDPVFGGSACVYKARINFKQVQAAAEKAVASGNTAHGNTTQGIFTGAHQDGASDCCVSTLCREDYVDPSHELLVALKLPRTDQDSSRLIREIRLLSKLSHPHIASLICCGTIGDTPYIATRWIEGRSVKELVRSNGPLSPASALQIALEVADALDHAHRLQITHGDISASNILIDPEGSANLIDFGIGHLDTDSTVNISDEIAGTQRYLAPELFRGDPPSMASDQYALAVLYYECLSGCWPYGEQTDSPASVMHHHIYSYPEPLCEQLPSLPAAVDGVVMCALEKDPLKRFSAAGQFARALDKACSNQPGDRSALNSIRKQSDPSIERLATRLLTNFAATVCVLTFASVGWFAFAPSSVSPAYAQSALSRCNLMPNPQFEEPLSNNFYQDPNNIHLANIVKSESVANSPILSLGTRYTYGMYGRIVPIDKDARYTLSANLYPKGTINDFRLIVEWLDIDWKIIPDTVSEKSHATPMKSRAKLENLIPPKAAMYAVPSVFRDGSPGEMNIDNMVFARADANCEQL